MRWNFVPMRLFLCIMVKIWAHSSMFARVIVPFPSALFHKMCTQRSSFMSAGHSSTWYMMSDTAQNWCNCSAWMWLLTVVLFSALAFLSSARAPLSIRGRFLRTTPPNDTVRRCCFIAHVHMQATTENIFTSTVSCCRVTCTVLLHLSAFRMICALCWLRADSLLTSSCVSSLFRALQLS